MKVERMYLQCVYKIDIDILSCITILLLCIDRHYSVSIYVHVYQPAYMCTYICIYLTHVYMLYLPYW